MEFTQPRGGGSYVKSGDILDQLILVLDVRKIESRYDEMAGRERDEAHVTFAILPDGAATDSIITNKYVVDRFKVGDKNVLGRVVQLPAKKPGQNGAIILDRYTDEDVKAAGKWLKSNPQPEKDAELDDAMSLLKGGLGGGK
jgi:hypothetical protein